MIHYDNCPLCSSQGISLFLKCRDFLASREEFSLYKCPDCGFIFTQDHPEEDKIDFYYQSEDYISHNDAAKGFTSSIYRFARQIMLGRKKAVAEKAAGLKRGTLLDIGCGTGYFAGTMKNAGWDVTCIEPNDKARKFASGKFGIEILAPGMISGLQDGVFDCITMWHVLEHFQDPFRYLEEIERLLKPGGICICALPNCSSYDSAYFNEFWAAYDVPRHLWHFTPDTFRQFTEKKGFRITGIRSLPLDVFYISILSLRNKGEVLSFVKGILTGLLFAFRSIFSVTKSSSIIYFLKREEE